MELERQYQLDDSYNVTNWIVLQLLDSPGRLAGLGSAISQGIAVVQDQVEAPDGANGGPGPTSGCSGISAGSLARPAPPTTSSGAPGPGGLTTSRFFPS